MKVGNLRFSPPVGFDMIVTVIVFVKPVCVGEVVAVRPDFVEDVLGLDVAEVA